jgi:hypothetical protein
MLLEHAQQEDNIETSVVTKIPLKHSRHTLLRETVVVPGGSKREGMCFCQPPLFYVA